MTREKRQGLRLVAVLAGVIIVVLVCIFVVTARIDDRLNQNAEQQVVTYTQQASYTITGRLELVFASMYAFNIESEDPARIEAQLKAFADSYGYTNAYFVNMGGEGISADGKTFTVADLDMPETALSDGRYSYSQTFKNKYGSGARMGQMPLYLDGKQIGALYFEVPLSIFVLPEEIELFDDGGYFILFEEATGEIIDVPKQSSPSESLLGESIYDFLHEKFEESETADYGGAPLLSALFDTDVIADFEASKTVEDESTISFLETWVQDRQNGVISAVVDGVPSYISMVPVNDTSWYVCSIVPFENVRSEMGAVNTAFWFVFFIVALCLALACAMTVMFFQRRLRANHVAMEENLYAALSESIDMAVNLYSPADGVTTPIVAKAASILGYPLHKVLDDPLLENVIELSADGREIFGRVREGDISNLERGEFSLRNPESGQTKWAVYAVEPLRFDGKDQILFVLQDVTTERMVRECMREAMDAAESANRAKSEFLSRMSHDIRTPMNVIAGMLQIAENSAHDEAKINVCLQKIGIASNQLLNLINEVLDFSKIESGKMVLANNPFSLQTLVEDVANMTRIQCDQKELVFLLNCDFDDVTTFEGDTIRLEQIMTNLLTNAVKYTDPGGFVSLAVHVLPEKVPGYRPVEFVVSDNGIGMSKAFQETLFEPFTMEGRSKSQGTGLGMSIVKSAVMLMGGTITVDSEIDKGTTFKVLLNISVKSDAVTGNSLPEQESCEDNTASDVLSSTSEAVEAVEVFEDLSGEVSADEAGAQGACLTPKAPISQDLESQNLERQKLSNKPGEGIHVLVVEDNELNAEIASELLGMAGFTVACAADGQEGVDMFAASSVGEYNVILMDVNMPIMDGYEATRRLRALDRSDAQTVIIVAMSANVFSDDIAKSLAAGMDAHLPKPMKVDRVVQTIYEILGKRTTS